MRRAVLAVVAIVLASRSVGAHHGYANFFLDQRVSIEGNIEALQYANPHVVMKIRTADSTVYSATWQSAVWLKRVAGVTGTTFAVGDHVVITGCPPRDPTSHELASLREVSRPRDGWSWHSQRP